MSAETGFTIASAAVVPGWLLLVFAPRWKWSARLIGAVVIPGLLALLYVGLLVTQLPGAEGGFDSLAQVGLLFRNPFNLLAGWVHYLAFDLFIGSWQVRDAQRNHVPHLLVVPCLVLTFLFGPAGWLGYLAIRTIRTRHALLDETV